jgi:hypothetical protein
VIKKTTGNESPVSQTAFPYVNPRGIGKTGLELASLLVAGVVHGRKRIDDIVRGISSDFDNLASLPLRYVYDRSRKGVYREFALPISFWGHRWNRSVKATNEFAYAKRLLADWLRKRRDPAVDALKPEEYAAIPNSRKTRMMNEDMRDASGITLVVEDPILAVAQRRQGWDVLLEVYPGLHMGAAELEGFAETYGIGLAYDTWHIRHDLEPHQTGGVAISAAGRPTRKKLGAWEQEIDRLLKIAGLVHFQPSREVGQKDELRATLRGERTELAAMTEAMRDLRYNGPVVVEYLFPIRDQLLDKDAVVSEATEIACYLKENLPAGGRMTSSGRTSGIDEGKEIRSEQ